MDNLSKKLAECIANYSYIDASDMSTSDIYESDDIKKFVYDIIKIFIDDFIDFMINYDGGKK